MNPLTGTQVHSAEYQAVSDLSQRWLGLSSDVVDIVMATAIGIYADGEPLWLLVVDASGGGRPSCSGLLVATAR